MTRKEAVKHLVKYLGCKCTFTWPDQNHNCEFELGLIHLTNYLNEKNNIQIKLHLRSIQEINLDEFRRADKFLTFDSSRLTDENCKFIIDSFKRMPFEEIVRGDIKAMIDLTDYLRSIYIDIDGMIEKNLAIHIPNTNSNENTTV
jgi:hypothetical protein